MNIKTLSEILLELKEVSLKSSADNIEYLMNKYDIMFLGSNFNNIYSIELCHCIKEIFHFNTSIDELNALIPIVCKQLNMKYNSLIALTDVGKPNAKIACYQITLWE